MTESQSVQGHKTRNAVGWIDQFFNWQQSLSLVPLGNDFLGNLVAVSSAIDVAFDESSTPDGGFKYIQHTQSLRANLLVIIDRGHKAFEQAQLNMIAIKLLSSLVVGDVKTIVHLLRNSESVAVDTLLPIPLASIRKTAQELTDLSAEVVTAFQEPMNLIAELGVACKAAQIEILQHQDQVAPHEINFQDASQSCQLKPKPEQELEAEMDEMSAKYLYTLATVECYLSKEIGNDKVILQFLEYASAILSRLEHHWNKAISSLRSMNQVVQDVSSVGLLAFADYVDVTSQACTTFSRSEMVSILRAAVRVHQVCCATQNMAVLYGKISDKYIMSSFDKLALMVVVSTEDGESAFEKSGSPLEVARAEREPVAVLDAKKELEMINQIETCLAEIENEYFPLSEFYNHPPLDTTI